MKCNLLILSCLVITMLACKKEYQAPVPDPAWDLFDSPAAQKLARTIQNKMEGIYTFSQRNADFGSAAALKWSYTITGMDTSYFFSFFCEKDVSYIICEGKRLDSSILLNGYWRKMINTETGKVRLTISPQNGARILLAGAPFLPSDSLILTGNFSRGNNDPDKPLQLRYVRPLYKETPLEILAHRGGGRTSDLLPASENSVELIKSASRFGATGIEIDVRLTSDGVPVLFHDATLNDRVIQKNGLLGPIKNYTYAQLSELVRLTKGEHIPTLREALNAVIYSTPLNFVWVDTKFTGSMQQVRELQKEFLQKARAAGRDLEIVIGIPDEDVRDNFLLLRDYRSAPSVCELSVEDVVATNARIWAPRWTLGLQIDAVEEMHAQGRKAFVWTLDEPDNINEYMTRGKFDGILTNYPSAVAFYYYAKQ